MIHKGVRKGKLSLWTYEYFANKSTAGDPPTLFNDFRLTSALQPITADPRSFDDLRSFYVDVLETCHDETDSATQMAQAFVRVWQLLGISRNDLQLLCKAAALVDSCLDTLVVKLTSLVDEVSCLFPEKLTNDR